MVTINGNPWFVVKDACSILGLTNPSQSLSHLAGSEKGITPIDTLGGTQKLTVVAESGLYKLIMRSRKPTAKPFQDWVTKVVLPAIRKDGGYIMGEEKVVTGEMSPSLARLERKNSCSRR